MLTSNKSNIYYPHKYIHTHESILNLFHLKNEALIYINLGRRQERIQYFHFGERVKQMLIWVCEHDQRPKTEVSPCFGMLCWKKEKKVSFRARQKCLGFSGLVLEMALGFSKTQAPRLNTLSVRRSMESFSSLVSGIREIAQGDSTSSSKTSYSFQGLWRSWLPIT